MDARHRIWAPLTAGREPDLWRIFEADGLHLADLELPSDVTVLDADGARLLLLRRDSLDVESVEVRPFRLEGPG